jgi:putative sterol carrier protein
MKTAKELMQIAQKKIQENKEQAAVLDTVYKFVLSGDDGGTFVINLADNPGVTEGDGAANCTIKMAAKDFAKMVAKRSDPRSFFFLGKLRVEGDMGLALKLKKFLMEMAVSIDD